MGMRLDRIARKVSLDQSIVKTEPFMQVDSLNSPNPSVVGPSLVVRGDLQGAADLRVSGQVHGNIRCCRLEVEKGGSIIGNIIADEIIVRGSIKGIIRAKTVILQDAADVNGEIYHMLLAIERGARLDGIVRRRENPIQCIDEDIVAAAADGGADPITLKYLVRPLLALRDAGRGDPVAWAKELSLLAGCHDSEVLSEAARRVSASGGECPSISKIAEACEKIDLEIGGQKTLSTAMYRMYALGAREWNPKWGPSPGQRGCRLRRDEQDAQWREIIKFMHSVLTSGGRPQESADAVGVKIVRTLEQNSGLPIDITCIPRRARVEFGIPATAKAMDVARALWQSLEGSALSEAVEPNDSHGSTEVAAA
jgi:cytoskeletal protein CcmA (bactofilin family)